MTDKEGYECHGFWEPLVRSLRLLLRDAGLVLPEAVPQRGMEP